MKDRLSNYWLLIIILLFICSLTFLDSQENNAVGKLTVNNEIIHLKYGNAIAQDGLFNENKEDILVILSDVHLTDESIENSFERKKMMSEGDLHCVEVIIDAYKNPISVTILHNAFKAPPSGRGYEVLEIDVLNDKIIQGRIYTSKANEFFDTVYEYDISFKSEIKRKSPPTGNDKKEASESIQAELYRKYESAILEADYNKIIELVSPKILEEMSPDDADEMFEFMQMTMPAKIEFVRLEIDSGSSVLYILGELENEPLKGKAIMILVNGEWKIDQVSWGD